MSTEGISAAASSEAVDGHGQLRRCSTRLAIASRAHRPSEKVRLILIGAGSRGNQLLDSFLPLPEVEIVAIVDVDDHQAGETAADRASA